MRTTLSKYKAADGKVLPVKYDKKTFYISENSETEIDLSKCDYQTCLHLQEAIKNKEIFLCEEELAPKTKLIKQNKGE